MFSGRFYYLWGRNLKVPIIFVMCHFRMVKYTVGILLVIELFQGEGFADYVFQELFNALFVIRFDSYTIMNVEPGNMSPRHNHLDESIVNQPLLLHR